MADQAATTLRVGFDAIRALRNSTGLGNYSRGVLRGLHEVAPELALHLYTPRSPRSEFASFSKSVAASVHLPRAAMRRPVAREWWRTFRLGRAVARDGMQLYHGSDLMKYRAISAHRNSIRRHHPRFLLRHPSGPVQHPRSTQLCLALSLERPSGDGGRRRLTMDAPPPP